MAEFGNAAALDYRMDFPQQQGQYAPPPPVAQQQQVDVPQYDKDPIAVRGKLTSDYYNNMGLLRSFAQDMAKKGIDPFTPDYSQDGGGLAFQTMQKLQAGLLYAANALGNEFKAEEQGRPAILRGDTRVKQGVDLNEGMAYSDPNNFYSTKLDPATVEANRRSSENLYTDADVNAVKRNVYDPNMAQLGNKYSGEELAYQQSGAFPPTRQTYGPSLIDRSRGLSPTDINGRIQLIRQAKRGILTNDPTILNLIKRSSNVQDAQYVNTGDRVGIEILGRGQYTPIFIDLSKGEGDQELNSYLNSLGGKDIPNEAIMGYDTKVEIPPSNAKGVLDEIKPKFKALTDDVIPKIQELASTGQLSLPDGSPIKFMEVNRPSGLSLWMANSDLTVTYNPIDGKGNVDYTKTRTKTINKDSEELDEIFNYNANKIAPAFGGGFVTEQSTGLTNSSNVVNPGGKKIF